MLGLTLILACMFPIGLYAHLILENVSDTDLIIPRLVNDLNFPFWVTDLLIVSIVSAAMSSMDSVLWWPRPLSTKTSLRHLKPLKTRCAGPKPQSLLSPALPPHGTQSTGRHRGYHYLASSLYAVCFFPPVVFGLSGRVASAKTMLVSMTLGLVR